MGKSLGSFSPSQELAPNLVFISFDHDALYTVLVTRFLLPIIAGNIMLIIFSLVD